MVRRGDHIKWRDDSLTRFGEMVIVAIDRAKLELRELWSRTVDPMTLHETESTGFDAVFLGQFEGWSVVRTADGHTMEKKLHSRDDAITRINTFYLPQLKSFVAQEAALVSVPPAVLR